MTEHRPWLNSYDPDVPVSLAPYPDRTLVDYLSETAGARPEHPAILFKGRRVSYGDVDRLSDQFAAAL
ncbi:MAG TPA: hypothetical protein VND92_07430, partial [Vicinamibacterales bacterium]|nr:hypothetical protein [Vicinamibacterales bacterium]